MIIRKATLEDIPFLVKIYEDAKKSLKDAGVDQWQDGAPNAETAQADIENGYCVVCEDNGNVIATAAVYVGTEPTYEKIYDGEWLTNNNEYGIIHRIAVSSDIKRGGIATQIIDYTANLTKTALKTSLRCDTHKDNIAMQKAMLKYGYKLCGTIIINDGTQRLAYEKLI